MIVLFSRIFSFLYMLDKLRLLEQLKFRDLFAGGSTTAILYIFAHVDTDDMVKGALIAGLTLIWQFYFRKKESTLTPTPDLKQSQ